MEPRYSNVSSNNDVEDDNSHSTRSLKCIRPSSSIECIYFFSKINAFPLYVTFLRTVIRKEVGLTLENTWNEVLGLAVNRVLTKDTTTIVSDASPMSLDITNRVAQIRNLIEDAKEDYGKEKLNERIARFSGEVAVIQRIYYYSSFCRTFRARNKELMTVVDVDSPKDMKLPQLHSLSNNLNIEYGELNIVVFGLLRYVNKYV
ncbi:RuBisCO large subunit-binding protein subunit beta, chloroplastic [Tanacetum coccineum]